MLGHSQAVGLGWVRKSMDGMMVPELGCVGGFHQFVWSSRGIPINFRWDQWMGGWMGADGYGKLAPGYSYSYGLGGDGIN